MDVCVTRSHKSKDHHESSLYLSAKFTFTHVYGCVCVCSFFSSQIMYGPCEWLPHIVSASHHHQWKLYFGSC